MSILQYAFAVTLLDGKLPSRRSHSFERMKDPRVLDLKKNGHAHWRPGAEPRTTGRPVHRPGNHARRSPVGKRVTTFKGRSENPLDHLRSRGKALELLEPVLGQSRTRS